MNLNNVQQKLFKATVNCFSFSDAYGVHIGDNLPEDKSECVIGCINILYIAGRSMKGVVDTLSDRKIYPIKIEQMGRLLNETVLFKK